MGVRVGPATGQGRGVAPGEPKEFQYIFLGKKLVAGRLIVGTALGLERKAGSQETTLLEPVSRSGHISQCLFLGCLWLDPIKLTIWLPLDQNQTEFSSCIPVLVGLSSLEVFEGQRDFES